MGNDYGIFLFMLTYSLFLTTTDTICFFTKNNQTVMFDLFILLFLQIQMCTNSIIKYKQQQQKYIILLTLNIKICLPFS